MRPAHSSMYGQPAYGVPQYYPGGNGAPVVQQYGRNPQEMAQPSMQPVYLVQPQPQPQPQPVMHQYAAVVGVPVGSAVVGVQGLPGYAGAQAWPHCPPIVESPQASVAWGYGADRPRAYAEQEQRVAPNWQRAPQAGYGGNGAPVGFQAHGNGSSGFQGRGEAHGNAPSFAKPGGDARRPDRGFESWHHPPATSGRQHMSRQGAPAQSPSPSSAKQMSCEACEKSFAVHSQYTAHMNTHVQCDELGCSFSASGKVVKEHKLTSHSKSSNLSPVSALKATSRMSEESNDEIKAWREERKRNYPTRLNIQRKKEVLEGKVARGELIEEDARKRRQRMKEILAKQAELGVPVAEVPSYYLSQPYRDDRARGRRNFDSIGKHTSGDGSSAADPRKRKLGEDADTTSAEDHFSKSARLDTDLPTKSQYENPEVKRVPQSEDRDEAETSQFSEKPTRTPCYFYQRGRCRKGPKCHFAHTRGKKGGEGEGGRRSTAPAAALDKKRPPTLLSKLLQADITRDKSYILQCLRFFVSNNFLLNGIVEPSQSTQLTLESDAAEESSDYSEGEVVEAPDMLSADTAITNTLLSERPEVLAKVMEMDTQA